jgi:energy-coupling factor transporter ATP-binding protein EcfA2
MIIVTHDLDLLAEVVSRVVVLAEGSIVADKLVADILSDGTTLRQYGYDLPEVVQLSRELQTKGRLVDRELYKEEDLRTALGAPSS